MLYLLDSNVLITAKNQYYEFARVDQYWEWLAYQVEHGHARIPEEIYKEVTRGKDDLTKWMKLHKAELLLEEEVNIDLVRRVIAEGYALDLTDVELEATGRDPFRIAYALADIDNRTVVTAEVRSKRIRQIRTIPSVCDDLNVKVSDQWQFGKALDFRTDWKQASGN